MGTLFPRTPVRMLLRASRVCAVLLGLVAGALPAGAAVVISTDTTVDYPIDDYVEVIGSATVALVSGGSITDGVSALDTSTVHVSDGSIGGTVSALDTSTVHVSGGSIGEHLLTGSGPAVGGATAHVSGGSIAGILAAYDTSTVHLSGGSIGEELRAYYSGVVHVYGSGLSLEEISSTDFLLTGTLADGTPLILLVGLLKGAQPSQIVLHDPGQLKDEVEDLVGEGALTGAEGHALLAKLKAAEAALERGNEQAAAGALRAFIRDVEALVRSGRLTAVEGQTLIEAAEAILSGL